MKLFRLFLMVFLLASVSMMGLAATAVFQDGISDADGANPSYAGCDSRVMISWVGSHYENASWLGYRAPGTDNRGCRTALRWDVSSLAGKPSSITGARAILTVSDVEDRGAGSVPDPIVISLYRLVDANAGWVPAEVGSAQKADGNPWVGGNLWTGDGSGYHSTPVATGSFSTGGVSDATKRTVTLTFTDVSFLQDWADNPGNNAGFMMTSNQEALTGGWTIQLGQLTTYADDIMTRNTASYNTPAQTDTPILEIDYDEGATPTPTPTPTPTDAGVARFQDGISDATGANPAYDGCDSRVMISWVSSHYENASWLGYRAPGTDDRGCRTAIRWDISSLTEESVWFGEVSDAKAIITVCDVDDRGTGSVPDPIVISLYRLVDANAGWVAAEVGSGEKSSGVSWVGGNLWTGDGSGYHATPVATGSFSTGGVSDATKRTVELTFTDVSFFADWVENPENNAGFMMTSNQEALTGWGTQMGQLTTYADDIMTRNTASYNTPAQTDTPILELAFQLVPVELSYFTIE